MGAMAFLCRGVLCARIANDGVVQNLFVQDKAEWLTNLSVLDISVVCRLVKMRSAFRKV